MARSMQWLREQIAKLRKPADEDQDGPSHLQQALPFFAVLLLVVIGVWVVWSVPHTAVQHRVDATHTLTLEKQLELEDAFRKTVSQIVLSLFGLLVLYFSWRGARVGEATVRIMGQGHITDRFTKAIDQLGRMEGTIPNIEVRLGAIYSLERIAIDSRRDHWTIMEILTAYVRQNAPVQAERDYVEAEKPRTDIQAILTVLGRRRTGRGREHAGQRLDLSRTRLCGAYLEEAKFQGAELSHADLHAAFLRRADLQGAMLGLANLQKAFLFNANLYMAWAVHANLEEADLSMANLRLTSFIGARLRGVKLQGAVGLTDAQLRQAADWTPVPDATPSSTDKGSAPPPAL